MEDKLDRYYTNVLSNVEKDKHTTVDSDDKSSGEENLDELLNELDRELDEDHEFLSAYRSERLQQISDHLKQVKKNVEDDGYGRLQCIDNEADAIQICTKTTMVVIHFELETFGKCQYMNEKLENLAKRYLTTRFIKVNVQTCPFLVNKLNIKVLPFVVGYKNGLEKVRYVGFSKLGNDPNGFDIRRLEQSLAHSGVIEDTFEIRKHSSVNTERFASTNHDRSESDSDLDI
ncbi:Plp1p [Saccharomyces cerevisiae YJM1190]|uniref:Plp1p n=1 Tax=Saccharomyces cerevisiae (strain JAY291) TaxID=574961 RepID=C7GN12_YEAS2|nr:Plp1p [Saccharomyces cerevisiae YJM555]AJU72027.1 Plp1p [Saccharomyces cerevisiae YJM682]AJU72736.1 Plp1p [Saccharomyces cerevisiae YJM683]AJU83118.1 Plp1p [Saccharomyces cerevisiae YJM1190]AJU92223.1 Plp1p [Saccharomyces cerevisiae YJM1326]AJU96471.1 Plp1p [Saccharomyces cerevisiae YJM1355]AJU99286.1 Plp1p [Saccharomyces cerevisiae YJM1385]AJV04199.1 Plp1p [Saccharomyces cerevisiae YJM1401]EEU07808.1 Plp1p [Saccharomyces cerevisiae JAY291]CAE6465913.1 Plp1p [Saccharomyces cerevisiae PE